MRAAGNRAADYAAVTRIEYADTEREDAEQWEEELVLARNWSGDAYLRAEVERQVMYDAGGARSWKDDDDGAPVPLGRGGDESDWPDEETREFLLEHDELWQLDAAEREQLCMLLVHRKNEEVHAKLAALSERYEKVAAQRQQLDRSLQLAVLKKAGIVGMTASAVGRLSAVVSALECEVVLVEGAEQLLEAHVIAALSPSTRHLLLVGDTRMQRANTAVARLSKQFRLDVSMLDRLANNGVDLAQLGVQRRMRAEIGRLMVPLYMDDTAQARALGAGDAAGDAAAAPGSAAAASAQRVPIRGIEKPVFFLRHEKPEAAEAETRSRSNAHEAKFVAALAAYLLRQGYAPSKLTILTPYCGQQLLIRRELHEHVPADGGAAEVVVTTVEQYRGEQNDLVLLSLVRSNADGAIGMLSVEHRVGDALSRARHGLYIVGNANLLGAESKLWESVLRTLKRDDAVGDFLPLLATRGDTGRHALVRSADDFVGIATEYERQQQKAPPPPSK